MKSSNTQKYFTNYACDEVHELDQLLSQGPAQSWDYVIAVPAMGEHERLPSLLNSITNAAQKADIRVVVCLCVNARSDSPEEVHTSNQRAVSDIAQVSQSIVRESEPLSLIQFNDRLDILLIDRFSPNNLFEAKQGVGLARKITCDLALRLIEEKKVHHDLILSTDADASVPREYFAKIPSHGRLATMLWPFKHEPTSCPRESRAIELYDAFLHYYVAGLKLAGSPYAFQTVGSCISFTAQAYVTVRGYPKKRMAGEDFYMINKLAKISQVIEVDADPITLSGRASKRVPFGTGASVISISEEITQGRSYRIYHPNTFRILKGLLQTVESVLADDSLYKIDLFENENFNSLELDSFQKAKLRAISEKEKILENIQRILGSKKSQSKKTRDFHHWFDAFRTMKFVHSIKSEILPEVGIEQACNSFLPR